MKNISLLAIGILVLISESLAQQMDLNIFRSSTFGAESFTTNSFKAIGVGKYGHVWAGTANQGLYKYNGTEWEKAGVLTNHNIADIKADKEGGIWIAQYGSSGAQALSGGIDYFPNSNFTNTHYGSLFYDGNLPTRNVRGLYIYNNLQIASLPYYRVWSANMADLTAGVSRTGAVGKGTNEPTSPFRSIRDGVVTTNGLGSCQVIGGNDNEVWVFASVNTGGRNQILRYNTQTEQYISGGDLDETTTNLPSGFTAKAIYFDKENRGWVGMQSGGVFVYENGVFQQINFPSLFPTGTIVNNNAITGDQNGNVYIGTTSGLVVFNDGSITDGASYKLYTTSEGLPSNNVLSIAVDTIGYDPHNIKIATANGIAFWNPNVVKSYNLINGSTSNRYLLDTWKISIAADSSTSTLIKFPLSGAKNCKVRIKEDINGANTSMYGYIIPYQHQYEDSILIKFHHPSNPGLTTQYSRIITLEVFDTVSQTVRLKQKLEIVRPPVLLVHGVWSSIDALTPMENYLISIGHYKYFQIRRIFYPNDIHSEPPLSALAYKDQIPSYGIDVLLQQCRDYGLSAGKVNIAAHSRGGLMARYYLQSSFQTPYRNDVNALITINTPHWGSQAANLILDQRKLTSNQKVGDLLKIFFLEDQDDPNGAVELKTNSETLMHILNEPDNTIKNTVPVHAIVSTYKFGLSRANVLQTLLRESAEFTALRIYLLTLGTECLSEFVDDCTKELFGQDNDIVVPLTSQKGGLADQYVTNLGDNIAHSNKKFLGKYVGGAITNTPAVMNSTLAHQTVDDLFNEDPNNSLNFIKGGFRGPFSPEFLQYNFLTNVAGDPNRRKSSMRTSNITSLIIDPSIKGQTFSFGQTADLQVTGSSDIKHILIVYNSLSLSNSYSDISNSSTNQFSFPIPKGAAGKVNVTAYGFDDNGFLITDSSFIYVSIPSTATLDSIKFDGVESKKLQVFAKDSIGFTLFGYFSDTVRVITGLPGITYTFKTGNIAAFSAPNFIKGITPNLVDVLQANFMNKTDSINVQVNDSISRGPLVLSSPLPITLISFTGEYKNNKVNLYWTTSQELNNKEFDIEYSETGGSFRKIGTVGGKENSSIINNYSFITDQFKEGKNYYRLKQIDIDRNYKYSPVIVINIARNSSISFYPNPAHDKMTLYMNQDRSGNIKFTDVLGQVIHTQKLNSNFRSQTIDLSKMSKGIYIISVTDDDGQVLLREKLLIN